MLWAVVAAVPSAAQPGRPFPPSYLLPVDQAWTTALGSSPRHGPAFDRERAFVALRNDSLVALDLVTGEQIWTVEERVDHPPVAGDGVVVTANGKLLGGRRASDGNPLWSVAFESTIAAPPLWNTGWLVVGTEAGQIAVLRGFDGRELWRRAMNATPTARPAIAGDRLYVPLADGRVVVLALGSGALIWERDIPGEPQGILALDALYVGSTDNHLYRLKLADGDIDWYWRTGGDIVGTPAADVERVYFTSRDNVLRALDRRNGARRWRRPLAGRPAGGPLRIDSVVVVAGISPSIEIFDTETGLARGQYVAASELAAMPHVVAGARPPRPHIILITGAGQVTGLAAGAGPPQTAFELPPEPFLPRPAVLSLSELIDWFPARRPGEPAPPTAILPPSGIVDRFPVQEPAGLPDPPR